MMTETEPARGRTVLIALNPYSGAQDRDSLVRSLEARLAESGYRVELSTSLEQVRCRVDQLRIDGDLRVVVSAGGDGTLSRLLNELPADTPMAIFPLGTENLMAKFLAQSANPDELTRLIDEGHLIRLDVARANGKLFLIMASCGFDADVVQRLHAKRSGHIRRWSYAKPIFESINQYRYPLLELWIDDASQPIEARWAFVFNVPRYAMNLPIVADAVPDDGMLDLCTFKEGNLLRGLYYFAAVLLRRHKYSNESQFARFKKLRIEVKNSDGCAPYQLDGDPGGALPLEIEIQPSFMRVLVSQIWVEKFRQQH